MEFSAQFSDVKIDNYFLSKIKSSFGIASPDWLPYAIYTGLGIFLAAVITYFILKRLNRLKDIEEIVQTSRIKIDYTINSERYLLDFLRRNSVVFDLVVGQVKWYSIAVRGIIISIKRKTIRCEIIEDFAKDVLEPGTPVTCTFKPINVRGKRISSFTTEFSRFEVSTRRYVRFELKNPDNFGLVKRRRHPRKKVLDQQYIRVKLWFENTKKQIDYLEAMPHVAVNSYDARTEAENENTVVNISKGGIALCVESGHLDEYGHNPGTKVVMNIFMYSAREEGFKAYWYSGIIRSSEEIKPGTTRLGIQFNLAAYVDQDNKFHWETL